MRPKVLAPKSKENILIISPKEKMKKEPQQDLSQMINFTRRNREDNSLMEVGIIQMEQQTQGFYPPQLKKNKSEVGEAKHAEKGVGKEI